MCMEKDWYKILKDPKVINDFNKLECSIVREKNGKFNAIKVFKTSSTHKIKNFAFPFLDIFSFKIDKINKNKVVHTYKYHRKIWINDYFFLDEIYPLRYCKFGNSYIVIPNNYNKYLDRMYPGWKEKGLITQSHKLNIYDIIKPIIVNKPFMSAKNFDNTIKLKKIRKKLLNNINNQ